jgi:hypothetical protein
MRSGCGEAQSGTSRSTDCSFNGCGYWACNSTFMFRIRPRQNRCHLPPMTTPSAAVRHHCNCNSTQGNTLLHGAWLMWNYYLTLLCLFYLKYNYICIEPSIFN